MYTNTSEYMYTSIQVNICIHNTNVYTNTSEYMYTHKYKWIYVYTNTSE